MIRIARQTDYAARILLHLSCLTEGELASISEIAAQRQLPVPFVRRLVGLLVKAGLLTTERGIKGGLKLARPSRDISLADVVRATEGPLALNNCVDDPHCCPFSKDCPVSYAWAEATGVLEETLSAFRFDQMATMFDGHVNAHNKTKKPRSKSAGKDRKVKE